MKNLKSENSFKIIGKGLVFTFFMPNENNEPKPKEKVIIDGKKYIVCAVERAMKSTGRGNNVSLIVKNLPL
jgi:hypothetical protein